MTLVSTMTPIETPRAMRSWAESIRAKGKRIALVPTMGFLHEGHLSLVQRAQELGDEVVVSIFVNPTQFGPNEDLDRYPQDIAGDLAKLANQGVKTVFIPSPELMYGPHFNSYVIPNQLSQNLCGASRPGHFQGVCTVVLLLFRITLCDIAIFGEKDFQQLQILKQMARDLWLDVDVVGMPIVREPDGLAMSSRNALLNLEERKSALSLNHGLNRIGELLAAGESNPKVLIDQAKNLIERAPHTSIDYLQLVSPSTLERVKKLSNEVTCAMAVVVGKTRLIDNRTYTI